MNTLIEAASHVRLHRGKVTVVKVGGACLVRRRHLQSVAVQIATIQAMGAVPVVVHGGGPQADALQTILGEPVKQVDGRRVTSPQALRAVRMAIGGELNSELAAAITAAGAPAVGFCAAAANLVRAQRRPPVATSEGIVDFGEVGDVQQVDIASLKALLDSEIVPVVCPPAGDGQGGFLNVNADLVAAEIAVALRAEKIIFLCEVAGIHEGGADDRIVSALTLTSLEALRAQSALTGGMLVKAASIERALRGGVSRAHVVSGTDPQALLMELYTAHGAGTMVTREEEPAVEVALSGA